MVRSLQIYKTHVLLGTESGGTLDTSQCWTWELAWNFSGAFRTVHNCSEYRMLEGALVGNKGRKVGFILHSCQSQANWYS